MQKITEFLAPDIEVLNRVIRTDLNSNIVLINQIGEYIINSGGKRIRPLITLLCGRIAGFSDGDLLHKMAAMIEYIHTATLLHDDVVDESGLRRGRKTANALFGNALSVLVGDFIYTRAFQMMVNSDSIKLLKLMADSTNKISEGEVLQLLNIGRSDLTEAEYLKVICAKTAVLFEASSRVAAIVSNASDEVEDALAKYAINLGIAFQIADDVLDYSGDTNSLGKNVGDDLSEGKVTLPLLYILKHGNEIEKAIIQKAIDNPDTAYITQIITIIKNSQAIDYSLNIAKEYAATAKNALTIFDDSETKQIMFDLVNLAVDRIN